MPGYVYRGTNRTVVDEPLPPPPDLSERQVAALRLVAEGYSMDGIRKANGLTEAQVRRLLSTAYAELGAKNRLHGIAELYRAGCMPWLERIVTDQEPTEIQRDVLQGMSNGYTQREIAEATNITIDVLHSHYYALRIPGKDGNYIKTVLYALRAGWIN